MSVIQAIDHQFAEFARVQRANTARLAEVAPPPLDALVSRIGAVNAELLRQIGLLTVTSTEALTALARASFNGVEELRDATSEAAATSLGVVRDTGRQVIGDARSARTRIANRASDAAAEVTRSLRVVGDRAERAGDEVADTAESAGGRVVKATDTGIASAASEGADRPSGAYENWTKGELYDRAQELDISGRSSMSKKELVSALRSA